MRDIVENITGSNPAFSEADVDEIGISGNTPLPLLIAVLSGTSRNRGTLIFTRLFGKTKSGMSSPLFA
jgi:hypothetical protein